MTLTVCWVCVVACRQQLLQLLPISCGRGLCHQRPWPISARNTLTDLPSKSCMTMCMLCVSGEMKLLARKMKVRQSLSALCPGFTLYQSQDVLPSSVLSIANSLSSIPCQVTVSAGANRQKDSRACQNAVRAAVNL